MVGMVSGTTLSRVYEICVTKPIDTDSDDGDYDLEIGGPDWEDPRLVREYRRTEAGRDTEASDHPLGNIVPGGRCTRQGTVFNRGTPTHVLGQHLRLYVYLSVRHSITAASY
eukprot:COSAG02_NODE_585_length_19988_cov_11.056061_3_plen_112_part_00